MLRTPVRLYAQIGYGLTGYNTNTLPPQQVVRLTALSVCLAVCNV